ncbi:MAG: UDP-N-acetylglucosamine 2-epimerase [Candidatus Magasanikbacteria bacterium GW2011_GWC2_41_17]|uniref:UDP-N-acetylglucosamine 2-epimerase n=2 Tax=Candidatus Magasanikiibacteriota TaxID=1752731 RepID=A0A0G0YVD9_9BACT|nr:MAG: UDP-N-acetylglucosamine 2-epimerase [Candidatus Magasanikbacteria bacterium GW2011_GWC2_41_17]KKS13631.1 MAG: UDP-N-acetylglucosamine 2-epimerase [Candidatus Magasanikbacteria bacterium GW2011_GWA2_41_55]
MRLKKRKILFITERRADYSRLKPIMKAVQESKKLKLLLLVTGAHLLKNLGQTKKVIEDDGFKIDSTLPIFSNNDQDDGVTMVKAMGKALLGMADEVSRLKPDIIFCGFDLGAHLAAAIVGMHLNIHVAHIQGGEVSGTIDEVIRHACTKFAHLHFVASKQSARRIVMLGEDPRYVFLVGSPSLDTIRHIKYFTKNELAKKYGLDPNKKLIIFLQHPVTTEVNRVLSQIRESLKALKEINKDCETQTIAIYSNNDAGGKRIVAELRKSGISVVPHIVYEDFLSLMKVADALVGNSSAGIHESSSFGLPTVNIGTRQNLRERGNNIVNVGYNSKSIVRAIRRALFDKNFIRRAKKSKNPYDHGDTAKKVVKILANVKLPPIQKVLGF